MSDFSSSNFIVQDDILSTAGSSDKTEENAIKYTKFWCFFSSTTTYQRFDVWGIFAIWRIIFSKKVVFHQIFQNPKKKSPKFENKSEKSPCFYTLSKQVVRIQRDFNTFLFS